MKKRLLLGLLAVFFSSLVFAQPVPVDGDPPKQKGKFWKSWGVGLSGNFVDLNYFDDALADDQRNLLDQDNLDLAGKLTIMKPLFKGLELGTSVALGDLEKYGSLSTNNFPVDERTFVDWDLMLAMRIIPMFDEKKKDSIRIDPFVYGSGGLSTIGVNTSSQFSVGAGVNFWLKRNEFAIRVESSYNSQMDGQDFLQHSIGVYHAFQYKKIPPPPDIFIDTLIVMTDCPIIDTLIAVAVCPPNVKLPPIDTIPDNPVTTVTIDTPDVPPPPTYPFDHVRIKFVFADSILTKESEEILDTVARVILTYFPDEQFEIDGHTDNVDTHDHNMKLSLDRAIAAANYLISKGVKRENLHPFGFGETKPLVKNNSARNRSLNRRVEVHMYSKSPYHDLRKKGKESIEELEAPADFYHPHDTNPYKDSGDAKGGN